jgi:hypothetical protein
LTHDFKTKNKFDSGSTLYALQHIQFGRDFTNMIVVMKVGSPEAEVARVSQELTEWGLTPEKIVGKHKVVIGLVGDTVDLDPLQIQEVSPWIEQVLRVEQPYKRASRDLSAWGSE